MRALVLFAGALAFVISCSSTGKKEGASATSSGEVKTTQAPSPSPTPQPKVKGQKVVECKNGLDERTIAVEPKDSGCQVLYTKSKVSVPVATSASGEKHCDEVAGRIKANLEKAGFKCD